MHETLTCPPFQTDDVTGTVEKHFKTDPTLLRAGRSFQKDVEVIVFKCLEKKTPENAYALTELVKDRIIWQERRCIFQSSLLRFLSQEKNALPRRAGGLVTLVFGDTYFLQLHKKGFCTSAYGLEDN